MAWQNRHVDVLIAIPHSGGEVYFDWAMEFANLRAAAPPNTFVTSAPEPQIDIAREKLCEIALQLNAKYIFFLDSDVLVPRDTIQKLMRHNLPIVAGLYARRYHPCWNQMLLWVKDEKGNEGFTPIAEGCYEKDALIQCDAVGFGCVLIQCDALKHMEKPWFRWTEHKTISGGMSEDFYFCRRARESGYKIHCDTSIVCRHMGPIKVLPSIGAQGLFEFKQAGQIIGDL